MKKQRLATTGLQLLLCVICVLSTLFCYMHTKKLNENAYKTEGVITDTEIQGEIKEIVLQELKDPNIQKNLTNAVATDIVTQVKNELGVNITDEETLKTLIAECLTNEDIINTLTVAISQNISNDVGSEVSNIDLSKYATKEYVAEVENRLKKSITTSTGSTNIALTEEEINKIRTIINNQNAGLTESDVINLINQKIAEGVINAALSNYRYTLSETEKTEIANIVTNSITTQLNSMSAEITSLKESISTLETQIANNSGSSESTGGSTGGTTVPSDCVTVAEYSAWKVAAEERLASLETRVGELNTLIGSTNISGYADGTITGAINDIETSLNGYKFKIVTETEYTEMVSNGTVDENTIYFIK